MEKVPDVQALLAQFPWARLEPTGVFHSDFALARFKLLGAKGFGYWSQSEAPNTTTRVINNKNCFPGYQLYTNNHLSDFAGWKLPLEWIPRLSFDEKESMPMLATSFPGGIFDWISWYKWRKLPLESPVVLLMNYPLSVYQLLTRVLRVIDPAEASSGARRKFVLHYLDATSELQFLPIFAELSLLLPFTDIDMYVFRTAVYDLVRGAPQNSIAGRALSTSQPIFCYKAPRQLGGSTINIFLAVASREWMPSTPNLLPGGRPDAVVALDVARLILDDHWFQVLCATHTYGIPFAVTEHAEQIMEQHRDGFPRMIRRYIQAQPPMEMPRVIRLRLDQPRKYAIEWNPFQRPGQKRRGSLKLPSLLNGFTMEIFHPEPREEGILPCGCRSQEAHDHEALFRNGPSLDLTLD